MLKGSGSYKRGPSSPNALRRQPRGKVGEARRYSYQVAAAIDGATFAALDAVASRRGVTRSWIIADMLREWAGRQTDAASAANPRSEDRAA